MKVCMQCGQVVSDEVQFCANCGNTLFKKEEIKDNQQEKEEN